MAKRDTSGNNFKINGNSIELFGLPGELSGKFWSVGINFGTLAEPSYVETIIAPAPTTKDVEDIISQDATSGNLSKISKILISSRIGVLLFLEGKIKKTDFDLAREVDVDTAPFMDNVQTCPAVLLNNIIFSGAMYQLMIAAKTSSVVAALPPWILTTTSFNKL